MINCPKCNELIGDQVNNCPFCRTNITEDDRKRALRDLERAHGAAVIEAMQEYSKRVRYEIISFVLLIIATVACLLAFVMFNLPEAVVIIVFVGIFVLYILSEIKLRIGHCPYCERPLGRGSLFISYCPRCSGRLR